MLQGRNPAVDTMTGGGRCHRRRKSMAGGRGTAEAKKIDANCRSPNLKHEFTEKPSHFSKITELPPASTVELDLYTQALKALSFRSPFDSEESQAPSAFVSNASSLPSGVSHFLSRQSDSRKRHKKLHSSSDKKSSAPGKSRGSNFWVEIEEYFRELTDRDVEKLHKVSSVGFSSGEKCFLIPSLNNDESLCCRYDTINAMLARTCEKSNLNLENGVELNSNGKLEQEENDLCSMDVDSDDVETKELGINEDSCGKKGLNTEKVSTSFSGIEWLLGSRNKIYLASERPSKKRKLLGRDAGLEKLLVACPVEGSESACHYCSSGNMTDPLNLLIKCFSCGMVVHQKCYGVHEDVDSSWMCSWCKWKNADWNTETPCLLCPKKGGALKPVQERGFGSDKEESKLEFAHLFCCQWIPEVYLEDTKIMEPIMNMIDLKDTRRKLICCLCKVKYGACVRCSNGSCRTSFHPICAREAKHRMEIWGKFGSEEVELRAFCSKHSEVRCNNGRQDSGDVSLTDGEDLIDNKNSELHSENGDAAHPSAICSVDMNDNTYVDGCSALNFSKMLKKLIDLGKVNAKDLATEIGVSADSLDTVLTETHMVPELRCKLLKWLKTNALGDLQKTLEVMLRSLLAPKSMGDAVEGVGAVSVDDSSISDTVPVKSVPPRRRTKSSVRAVVDDTLCLSKDKTKNDGTTEGDTDVVGEDPNNPPSELLPDENKKIMIVPEHCQDVSANNSIMIEDELITLVQCLSEDGQVGETRQIKSKNIYSLVFANGEVNYASYIHPFIYSKLMQTKNEVLEKTASCQSAVLRDREASQLEASSSSGLCCNNQNLQATSSDRTSRCNGVDLDELVEARNVGILKLSPADEVEGELIYYQQSLIQNAVVRKRISDDLISKVVRGLPQEIDAAGKQKWDDVLVSQYIHDLREAKKQGRKERRHKEAQAVLAAATAAAAASSRSSIRKDTLEESSQQEDHLKMNAANARPGFYSKLNPRAKETISRSTVARPSFDINSDSLQLASQFSKDRPRTCGICRRSETALNPILVCSSCKIAVHMDCYRSVKSATGPWHCELCEDLFASRGSGAVAANSWEKPYFVAECDLCGGTAGAFRKSVGGQWIHALCAEWVLESTYRRGQINPIEGMDSVSKGVDTCTVCHRKQGVCLKCSYGHCQTSFHPTCASSAGFYMTVRNNGGKLQHKAYCEKHSTEQRAKADTQKHGVEEFKSLKQVRVELERLRLLCERIIRREKLKRELVLCSHDVLASSRDSVLSALARHPFYQPEASSESATTSIKGFTDGYKSSSEMVQRSDDISVDSTIAGKKRCVKLPMSVDKNDQRTVDSSISQNVQSLNPLERVSFSGKQIPQRHSVASRNLSEDVDKRSKFIKQTETFEKELIMTSDQATMKNQRLPKGFVYVPIRCLSKDKETVPDACSRESVERKG